MGFPAAFLHSRVDFVLGICKSVQQEQHPGLAYTITGSLRAVWQWKVMSLLTTLCEAMARSREECLQKYIVLTQAVRLFTSVFSYLQQWILIQQQFVSWFVFWKWNWKPVLTGGK